MIIFCTAYTLIITHLSYNPAIIKSKMRGFMGGRPLLLDNFALLEGTILDRSRSDPGELDFEVFMG